MSDYDMHGEAVMEYHPAANIFPLMQGAEYEALCDDITEHGLHEDILVYEGRILDGRNRYRACIDAGVEPRFCEWDGNGSALDMAISKNLHRRHLNPGQLAFVAAEAEKMLAVEAKERQLAGLKQGDNVPVVVNLPQREKGRAREQAAAMFGVSPSYVQKAKKMNAEAPDLAEKVKAGEVTLSQAARKAKKTTDEKRLLSVVPVEGKFRTLVIDPPWDYEGLSIAGRAEPTYATMTHDELLALDVEAWAEEDCHLYLWTTNNFITRAIELMAQWGFQHKTILTWVKPRWGLGSYFRNQTEHVLFGVKGNLPTRADNISTIISAPTGAHSEKPAVFYDIVRAASYPPYGEVFQRASREAFRDLFGGASA